MRVLVMILVLPSMIGISGAHDASLTYTVMTIDSGKVGLKMTVPMDVLTSILPGPDWYEPVKDVGGFEEYLAKNFVVKNEGVVCKRKLIKSQCLKGVREYSFTFELTSETVFDNMSFTYNMIFEYLATHENIAEFIIGNRSNEFIFSKEKKEIYFSVNELRKQWGMQPFGKGVVARKDITKVVKRDSGIQKPMEITAPKLDMRMDSEAKVMNNYTAKMAKNQQPFGGNDLWKRFVDFFVVGVEHILTGYDHIMFLLGLLLMIMGFGNLLKVITAFTIAHSITLAIAVFGIYALPSALTETMIALSISFVAFENIYIQKIQSKEIGVSNSWQHDIVGNPKKRWRLTFLFGLIHGFGFSAALREIGIPEGTRAISLFSFNLGVEAGQLMLVAAVFPFLWYARRKTYYQQLVRIVSITIGVAGLGLVLQRIFLPKLF